MANISKIKVGQSTYDIKDASARNDISTLQSKLVSVTSAMHFIGITTTALTDGATTTTLAGDGLVKTTGFANGDFVIYNNSEFVWNTNKWNELGSTGSLKKLAFKDEATGSGSVTLSGGSVTAGKAATFTQGAKASFTQGAKASFKQGAKAALNMTVTEETLELSFTPNGDDTFTPNGNDSFTPNGSDSFTANTPTAVTLPTSGSGSVTVK